MTDPKQVARVRDYIERHRHVYSDAALRRCLIADGVDSEIIDLAWAELPASLTHDHTTDPPTRLERLSPWIALGVLLLNGLWALIIGLDRFSFSESHRGNPVFISLFVLIALVEFVVVVILRTRNTKDARSMTAKLALVLALSLLLFGSCLVVT